MQTESDAIEKVNCISIGEYNELKIIKYKKKIFQNRVRNTTIDQIRNVYRRYNQLTLCCSIRAYG